MSDSRISGLHRLTVSERIDELTRRGWLSETDAEVLRQGRQVLLPKLADKMIENVIGTFGLPLAIAPNFTVNQRDYVVPMVVEEPSVVAAVSGAARLARATGGFDAHCEEALLAGQVHVTQIDDPDTAIAAINREKQALITAANAVHPRLVARGGGVSDIAARRIVLPEATPAIAVHLLVDTCNAMGANLVNTICEAVAPRIAEVTGGKVALRILSNLADRSLVSASVRIRLDDLVTSGFSAELVRDRIVVASDIARADAHRAATHNKGIMNGVDALAIATGNDWRAIEAGAHAYAASSSTYAPLATWSADSKGDLRGQICLPLRVGIVGGTLAINTAAAMALRITGVESARELAELMAAVGLAQNFAAIRALATTGIQDGHMRLHARSPAAAASEASVAATAASATAAGKVILLGEHAVVYGKHALALPITDAVSADIIATGSELTVSIPEWGVQQSIVDDANDIGAAIQLIMRELGIDTGGYSIRLHSDLPRAMGLGSSAAFAVAMVRAFDATLDLGLDDVRVNSIAFECEKLAHGTPSGVDNAIATYAVPMLFRNTDELHIERLVLSEPAPIVIAASSQAGLTKQQVAGVRARYAQSRPHYDALFNEIDKLSTAGALALQKTDYDELGALMNLCHGLLNAMQVSTPEIESMVSLARSAGAVGAKLTGAGGGGSVVALCPGTAAEVVAALTMAGFDTFSLSANMGTADG